MSVQVREGSWHVLVGERLVVAVAAESAAVAAAAWPAIVEGAGPVEVLDAVLAALPCPGLSALPGVALVGLVDGVATVVLRGSATATLTTVEGERTLRHDGTLTWSEHRHDAVSLLRLDLDGAAVDEDSPARSVSAPALVLGGGVVVTTEAPAPGLPQPPEPSEPSPGDAVARLQLSHGETIDVDGLLLIGRAPEARRFATGETPRLVAVPSPQHEISASHLEVRPGTGPDVGAAVVTDLGSTNGTSLRQPGLPPESLLAGVPVALLPGAVLDLGDGVTIRVLEP